MKLKTNTSNLNSTASAITRKMMTVKRLDTLHFEFASDND